MSGASEAATASSLLEKQKKRQKLVEDNMRRLCESDIFQPHLERMLGLLHTRSVLSRNECEVVMHTFVLTQQRVRVRKLLQIIATKDDDINALTSAYHEAEPGARDVVLFQPSGINVPSAVGEFEYEADTVEMLRPAVDVATAYFVFRGIFDDGDSEEVELQYYSVNKALKLLDKVTQKKGGFEFLTDVFKANVWRILQRSLNTTRAASKRAAAAGAANI